MRFNIFIYVVTFYIIMQGKYNLSNLLYKIYCRIMPWSGTVTSFPEDHITIDVVKSVLSKDLKIPMLEFTDVTFSLGQHNKDGGQSSIIASLEVKSKTTKNKDLKRKYFVKITNLATDGSQNFLVQSCHKELMMFEKVFPSINELLTKLELPRLKTPTLFHGKVEPTFSILILNDLSTESFKMVKKTQHFDLRHIRLVMEELGRFHAGYVLWERKLGDGLSIADSNSELFAEPWVDPTDAGYDPLHKFLSFGFKILVALLEKENYFPLSRNWLKQNEENCILILDKANKPTEKMRVLSHGDSWGNNFLFRYDGSAPIDMRMLDFSFSRMSTPAFDILFTIYSTMDPKVRTENHKEILSAYYNSFKNVLMTDADKHVPFTFEDLEEIVEQRFISVLMIAMAHLQSAFQNKQEDLAVEKLGAATIEDYNEERMRINMELYDEYEEYRDRFLGIFEDMEKMIKKGNL